MNNEDSLMKINKELYKNLNEMDSFLPTVSTSLMVKLVTSYSLLLVLSLCLTCYLFFTTHSLLFLALSILILLLGIWFTFYFYKFYKQFRHTLQGLKDNLLESSEEKKELLAVVNNQKPLIKNTYVRQLLTGSVNTEEEFEYIYQYMDLEHLSNPHFNVLYCIIYNNFGENSTDHPEASDENKINHIIQEAFSRFFQEDMYFYIPSSRTYAILLAFSDTAESEFVLKAQDKVREIHNYLLNNYGIWLFAGIGKNTNSLMHVWESYQQATEAVNYTTKNYIFLPYEMIKKDSNVFYYPPELSTKMIHFITTGNRAQVMELFNLVHQENIEERSLPLNLIRFLLSDIRNTLLKARFALPQTTDPEVTRLLDERFNEPLTFQLCESLALTLCKLFDAKEENESLSTTIEKYIIANFKDPSLCLNKISESYFSHMFKDKTGVNFSTYLENIRMAEAVRLIKETDISLNELYLAVGYNNQNSFRRAFKKIYGVTPSSMR